MISQTSSNPSLQLAATAAVSAGVAVAAVLGYQRLQQGERVSRLKQSIPDKTTASTPAASTPVPKGPLPKPDKEDEHNQLLAERARRGDFDDELILEQLTRNRSFLGDAGLQKLRSAFVIVVGVGGVGSHATVALARSGVSKLRLIDFDQVSLSSLNRHAIATLADVGIPKVSCLEKRLMAIAPWVHFDLRLQKFEGSAAPELLAPWGETGQKPDFVIDAIDNIDSKVELLKYCYDHSIPVISSMGAGTKGDPTKIMVGDIGESTDDSLSRATRRRLKLLGVTSGIPVIYSTERPGEGKATLLPISDEEFQKGTVGDLGPLPDFRVRILPVLGTLPACFGLTAANHVILKITGYPVEYSIGKARYKMYDGILASVQATEEKLVRQLESNPTPDIALGLRVPVTQRDVEFLVEEVYKGRSILSGSTTKIVLVRWGKPKNGTPLVRIGEQKSSDLRTRDLVVMTKEEAARHLKEVLVGGKEVGELYGPEVLQRVERGQKMVDGWEWAW